MNDLIITHPTAFHYSEANSGDVDAFAARTDALGQPTLAAWRLDHAGANTWSGSLASGGPNDSSDAFVFDVPEGRAVQGISLNVSNVQINSGSTFFLSTLDGQWWIERPLTSFNEPIRLEPGQYSLLMGNGTLVLDYQLMLDVITTQDTPPTLSAAPRDPEYQGSDVLLFSDVTANTHDEGQLFTHLHLRVAGVKDGGEEILTLSGVDIALKSGERGNLPEGRYSIIESGGELLILVVGFTLSEQDMGLLVANMRYRHAGTSPTEGEREIKLALINDDGQANFNKTTLDIVSTVSVPAPVVTAPPQVVVDEAGVDYLESAGPVAIAPSLLLSDADSATLVSARVTLFHGELPGDVLAFQNGDTSLYGDITGVFAPGAGTLTLTSSGHSTLAQWQNALRAVTYQSENALPSTSQRQFQITAFDGKNSSIPATTHLNVTLVNQAPVIQGWEVPALFTEGASPVLLGGQVDDRELNALDDYAGASLMIARRGGAHEEDVFTLKSRGGLSLIEGVLAYSGTPFARWESDGGRLILHFDTGATKALVDGLLGSIQYANVSKNPPAKVALEYAFNDGNSSGEQGSGGEGIARQIRTVAITPVNDAPELATNTGASVVAGQRVVITQAMLHAQDPDDAPEALTYRIKSLPASGTLLVDGVALGGGDTFTQADIDAGRVSYLAGSQAGKQALTFSLADGGEDGVLPLTGLMFTLTVDPAPVKPTPPPAPETPTPGGWLAPVVSENVPDTPSGRPGLREVFTNASQQAATVRLVENSGSENLVSATLPGGVGLVHEGARTASSREAALADLVGSVSDKAPGNLGSQAALSERWLDSRAEAALIDVRSLTFSAEAPLNSPIVLRGEPGTSTSSAFKAFIIDTTGLPGGARIVLEHIDFVSLKGSATLVGGAGESVIIGDDAPLNLTLGEGRAIVVGGAGDDVLIGGAGDSYLEGGEGSNRFYTKAGNDTLVGGSDVDVVRFDAAMDEVSITRDDAGRLVVSGEGNGRNTLTGVELLRFDDRVVLVDAPSLADDTIVLFDEAFYLRQNADVAEAVARGEYASGQAHFERFGAGEGREASDTTRNANLAFDEEFYLAHNPDVAAAIASGVFASAFEHYSRFGEQEGRNPNVLFDERAYRAANADVDAAIEQGIFDSAYLHYRLFGEGEGRAPSAWFDLAAYQAANPDVVAAGVGGLGHYLQYGMAEGRIIVATDDGLWG